MKQTSKICSPGSSRPRVAFISTHPAPYRDSTLALVHQRGLMELTALTLFQEDAGHSYWNLDKQSYPNMLLGKGFRLLKYSYFHPRILPSLILKDFDVVVVPGYRHLTCQLAIAYCIFTHTPLIYSADSAKLETNRKDISPLLRFTLKHSSTLWVPGKASRAYAVQHGVNPNKIYEGCYNLDSVSILKQIQAERICRNELRSKLDVDDKAFVFLMVANMIKNRNHLFLLNVMAQVVTKQPRASLLLIGLGPERQKIEEICNSQKYSNIRIVDPVPFNDLPKWYAACDAYVHSGSEPYSTALAYAAKAGLPIVSSRAVGATWDYVVDGESGYIVEPEDEDSWIKKMILLASDRKLAIKMGKNAQNIAMKRTTLWAAEQLEAAIVSAVYQKKDQRKPQGNKERH